MSVFVTSKSSVTRHGAFGIEVQPPSTILPLGTGTVGLVGQFPWGPLGSVFQPTSYKQALDTLAPAGMSRTGAGYMALMGKGWPSLRIVRVLGPTAVVANVTLSNAVPTAIVRVDALYKGTAGNSLVATVAAASDGDANHFDLTVSVTGATGVTTDTFRNLNYSGVGTDSAPDFTKTLLVGNIVKLASGRPINGASNFASGTDGTITASEYVGTAGSPDKGISLLESEPLVRHVCTDDPGNSLRAAVNAGLKAHAELMGDRVSYLAGPAAQTLAALQTDVALYRSDRCRYADPWYRQYDDTTGALQLVHPASMLASVKSQLSPSTSSAWKAQEVRKMTRAVVSLETDRGDAAGTLTLAGVTTMIKEQTGGFTYEAGVNTNAPSNPATKNETRTAMLIYIATALINSVREVIDSPNVEANQEDVVGATQRFLEGLKKAQKTDPNHTPHIRDYSIRASSLVNSQASIDAGDFDVPIEVKTTSPLERLFFLLRVGETVTITAS